MKYYVGKGTEFKKEECKEYKTLDGALKAAAKDESLVVWDENGEVIGSLTNKVPDGALETNENGSVNTYNEDGQQVGTVDPATVAAVTGNEQEHPENTAGDENGSNGENTPPATGDEQNGANESAGTSTDDENGNNGENTPPATGDEQNGENTEENADTIVVPQGTMKVTVVCDGALNLRRSAAWGNGNICGRAARGQSYYVKEIHTVDGKKMVRTIDDLYLSGASEHVQFEQL